jgi:hypothetical protein
MVTPMLRMITPASVACLGLVLFVIGNELGEAVARQILEISAGVLAAIALAMDVRPQ